MGSPLDCRQCADWWTDNRETVVRLIDRELVVDEVAWATLQRMGISGLRGRKTTKAELIEYIVGRYHRSGHVLYEGESSEPS